MKRPKGRAWLVCAGLTLAAGVLIVAGAGRAIGGDRDVEAIVAQIARTGSDTELRDHLEQLREIGNASSRRALEEIAGGDRRMPAILAAHTIAREAYEGADAALRRVFEDAQADRAVRTAAGQGLLRLQRASGVSAQDSERYFDAHLAGDARLATSIRASRAAWYPAAPVASGATREEGR